MKYLIVVFCLIMAAINLPFIFEDPTRWLNWASLVFCSLMALLNYLMVRGL